MSVFESSPKSWIEVFRLIEETTFGRRKIQEFLKLSTGGRIQVQSYPNELRGQLKQELGFHRPLGAVFVTDGFEGTIYLDGESSLGVLAPFLFHEIIHCLDESLWKVARGTSTFAQKREILFGSEVSAFRDQAIFQRELNAIYPELKQFYHSKYPEIICLNRALSPSEIADSYCRINDI